MDARSDWPLGLDPGLHGANIDPYVGQDNWTTCDWHGVWVTDIRSKGSYGKVAYRYFQDDDEDEERYGPQFWVRWFYNPPDDKRGSASLVGAEHLNLLPVKPEPWF